METKLINGDYVANGLGGVVRCKGDEALLARVLYRLTARRGQFPPMPALGSRLYLLGRESVAQRPSAARLRWTLFPVMVTVTSLDRAIRGPGREKTRPASRPGQR